MTLNQSLSREKRRKIAHIKEALGKSDRRLHRYMLNLDRLDRSAKQHVTRDVSGPQIRILNEIHDELLRAQRRLGALDTGLRAEKDLRKALIESAAGYAAWRSALRSRDLRRIASAQTRMQRHFDAAANHGQRGTSRLKRGI